MAVGPLQFGVVTAVGQQHGGGASRFQTQDSPEFPRDESYVTGITLGQGEFKERGNPDALPSVLGHHPPFDTLEVGDERIPGKPEEIPVGEAERSGHQPVYGQPPVGPEGRRTVMGENGESVQFSGQSLSPSLVAAVTKVYRPGARLTVSFVTRASVNKIWPADTGPARGGPNPTPGRPEGASMGCGGIPVPTTPYLPVPGAECRRLAGDR